MSKGIQVVLKCLAVLLALGMLAGYVWTRQRAATPDRTAELSVDEANGFPVTPSSPTLFDTSKSGKLTVEPTLFSTSKSGPVDLGVTLVPEEGDVVPADADEKTDPNTAPAPVLMPGSKSINGLLFNTKEVSKAITIWDGETVNESDTGNTKKEKPKKGSKK